jgi:cell division protein FtsL
VTSYAESAHAEPRRRRDAGERRERPTTTKSRSRAKPRSTLGGLVWIALVALLLAGVVAVNVAVLRLNVQLDRKSQERLELQADVARLQSERSSVGASAAISRDARDKLGLVDADPAKTTYVRLAP